LYSSIVKKIIPTFLVFLIACAPINPPSETQVVNIYSSPAAQPWLADVYACVPQGTSLKVADTPALADLSLHLGDSGLWQGPAFQIGAEDILIITDEQSPIQDLTLEDARALFAGVTDPSIEVWVYASQEDIQITFEQEVMAGRPVTSLARLAVSPRHMSDSMLNTPTAIGILPRRWKTGDVRDVYTIPDVPVLALIKDESQQAVRQLLDCLQP